MGSKSQDTQLARSVIALKSNIDRLKEQAANLE
ncbi:MAG: endoribonuclease YicC domain-containing protein [Planctomycetota bacterium]